MTNYEARKATETREMLIKSNGEQLKIMTAIHREYLNQKGLDALLAHKIIEECLTFASSKREVEDNLNETIEKGEFYQQVVSNEEKRITAKGRIEALEKVLRNTSILPTTHTYLSLFQNIQSLYFMEKYDLVCVFCDEIITELQ